MSDTIPIKVNDYRLYPGLKRTENSILSLHYITLKVCYVFGVDMALVRGRTRKRRLVMPRQIAQFCCFFYRNDMSLTEVGRFFDRDHSTVIHSISVVRDLASVDENFKAKMIEIIQYFGFNEESLNYNYIRPKTY